MKRSGPGRLSARLALASLGTAAAVGVVCAVGLVSLGNLSRDTRAAVSRQIALIDESGAFAALLYQKGFAAEYMLTRDRSWLMQIESSRPAFETWLAQTRATVSTPEAGALLETVAREYDAYRRAREEAVATFDAGDEPGATAMLMQNHARLDRILAAFRAFGWRERQRAELALEQSERSQRRLAWLLVGTALGGAAASLVVGFLWARRFTKPIYELQVQVESAAERTRIQVSPGRRPGGGGGAADGAARASSGGDGEFEGLGEQVAALIEKLEETDASLAEHRRRLIQSEKLSAIGELAAKLAHEVLNPLAGMKAAVQLLARSSTPSAERSQETARALGAEIARVEVLMGRLLNFARPLAPRVQVTAVGDLLDAAEAAAREVCARHGVNVQRREAPGLPPLEVDPLLVTQALSNLLSNAAQAMPAGGAVDLHAERQVVLGREEVAIRVADRGAGIPPDAERMLFHPFFTTKPNGHGLGLAVSQNIAVEHGGRIVARNRPPADGPGAIFELLLPIVR
jgi:signal transduction histidine kinase